MDGILEYLERKHKEICKHYEKIPEDNRVRCTDLAMEIAIRFIRIGRAPRILRLSDDEVGKDGILRTKKLIPIMFNGRVEWNFHDVCSYESLVYDPFLEKPCFIKDYSVDMFGKEVPFFVMNEEMQIGAAIERYIRKPSAR